MWSKYGIEHFGGQFKGSNSLTNADSRSTGCSGSLTVTVTNLTVTISGTVFVDVDGDGLFEGGTETAIDAVMVELGVRTDSKAGSSASVASC